MAVTEGEEQWAVGMLALTLREQLLTEDPG